MAMLTRYNPRSWMLEEPEKSLMTWDPLGMRRELDRLFEDFFRGFPSLGTRAEAGVAFAPRLNLSETEEQYEVELELPGLKKEDVDISVSQGGLTIQGECKHETAEEGRRFHRVERCYGNFRRTLSLPQDADPEQVKAKMENGVLTVTVAKSKEAQMKSRKIDIQ